MQIGAWAPGEGLILYFVLVLGKSYLIIAESLTSLIAMELPPLIASEC